MKAVLLTGHGGLDKLQYRDDVPVPVPRPGEALVRVSACGLNNTDINTRTAWYSGTVEEGITENAVRAGFNQSQDRDGSWGNTEIHFPRIQGADVCGTVKSVSGQGGIELVGRRVMIDPWFLDSNNPGDLSRARYFGSETNGGFAQYTVAPIANIYPVNSKYTDAELATFGCAYTTAENMIGRTGLSGGESIAISGASGGVGTAAIQLAKLRGATVIAISSPGKQNKLMALGADHVLDRNDPGLPKAIRQLSGGNLDVAADTVGGDMFTTLIDCLRPGGRYSSCGAIAGPVVRFDLRKLIYRDLQLTGATVVPAGTFRKLLGYVESGRLRPVLAETWPLHELARAQESFMKKQHVGNIVVTMEESSR